MKKINYSGLNEQISQHAFFVKKIEEFEQKYKANTITLSSEVMIFLKDWIVNHITKLDTKIKP